MCVKRLAVGGGGAGVLEEPWSGFILPIIQTKITQRLRLKKDIKCATFVLKSCDESCGGSCINHEPTLHLQSHELKNLA